MSSTRPSLLPLLVPACLAGLALSPACSAQDDATRRYADAIVAIVEGEPIMLHELELACRFRPEYHALEPGDSLARQEFRRQLLERGFRAPEGEDDRDDELALITQRALLHRAKETKIALTTDDEERVNEQIARIAERQRGGMIGLRGALAELGVPWERFVERQRANLIIQKLLLTTVSRDIFINPAEIRRHYDERLGEYERGGEVRLRQLVLYADPDEATRRLSSQVQGLVKGGAWDARAFALDLRRRIVSGEVAFEDASRELSMEHGSERELALAIDKVASQFRAGSPVVPAILSLPVGEVSPVIEEVLASGGGGITRLHLVLVTDRQERGYVPFEQVQETIELRLKDEVWRQRRDAFIDRTRAEAHVEVFADEPPPPPPPPDEPPAPGN